MTTNKPEVFEVYRTRQGTLENVVLLADYEALQTENENLRKDAELKHAALEREVEELRGYITAAANRAGLAWHQGNTDGAVFWRAALVGIERDLRKALAGGEAG